MNVSKLIIKEVIDSSLSHGRMLDDNHVPLQQFFIVLEHVLRHGLKRTFYALVFQKKIQMYLDIYPQNNISIIFWQKCCTPVTRNIHFVTAKKSLLRDRRDFWCVLETVEKLVPEASEITTSVREMPSLKWVLGIMKYTL